MNIARTAFSLALSLLLLPLLSLSPRRCGSLQPRRISLIRGGTRKIRKIVALLRRRRKGPRQRKGEKRTTRSQKLPSRTRAIIFRTVRLRLRERPSERLFATIHREGEREEEERTGRMEVVNAGVTRRTRLFALNHDRSIGNGRSAATVHFEDLRTARAHAHQRDDLSPPRSFSPRSGLPPRRRTPHRAIVNARASESICVLRESRRRHTLFFVLSYCSFFLVAISRRTHCSPGELTTVGRYQLSKLPVYVLNSAPKKRHQADLLDFCQRHF